jgi:hypothetical protein
MVLAYCYAHWLVRGGIHNPIIKNRKIKKVILSWCEHQSGGGSGYNLPGLQGNGHAEHVFFVKNVPGLPTTC